MSRDTLGSADPFTGEEMGEPIVDVDTSPQNDKPEPYPDECAVAANCETGKPDDWFEVHYSATGQVFHFCARHALPAEALMTLGGWRGCDIPDALRLLERGGARALPNVARDGGVTERGR
jgi:hypothetical protein